MNPQQTDTTVLFDLKGFLVKLLRYWPLFVISIAIAFAIAYYINVRKLPVYKMENMISIKDDQNPFFTSNTSLTFNWGGTTDKVNTAMITLKSRSHNEKVVERLQYYINYQKDGEYQRVDAYGYTPFKLNSFYDANQALYTEFKVTFIDSATFDIEAQFPQSRIRVQNYATKEIKTISTNGTEFKGRYQMGDTISTPFFKGIFYKDPEVGTIKNTPFYISFIPFDNAVKRYLGVNVLEESRNSTIIKLSLVGLNKNRIVEYLNSSVKVLSDDFLDRKNLFATKTIKFIDSSLAAKSKELKEVESELNNYKNNNAIFDLEMEGVEINNRLTQLELREENINRELNYLSLLEEYLRNKQDYSEVPAPSVASINEQSIVQGVGRIITLAEEREKLEYSFKPSAPVFADIDRRINAVKEILFENISSSREIKNSEKQRINNDLNELNRQIRKLPKEQQELLKIERRYNISQGTYNIFLSKRNEAGLVKAANVSDVLVIDPAKDTGDGQVGPDTKLNYIIAAFFGFLIPFIFVFILTFFDNKVQGPKDLEKLTTIPILGVIGKSSLDHGLAVLRKPKSAVAESFRAIRSSLQFMYKKQGIQGAKTVLITSSVSGEGKTFCSINIASVFALSEKKTVLVGLDLRKPKIFDDFDIHNEKGVVNYLIDDEDLTHVIQKTELQNLDIITSGPIPPNPSELLMSDKMDDFIQELKQQYDYIILDSPPLGLVADALELTKYADASIYMARQGYTKKGMFGFINEKYRKGEVTNISIVLNFFADKAKYGYGGGYGYGYGYGYGVYGNGYHEDEVKKPWWKRVFSFIKR